MFVGLLAAFFIRGGLQERTVKPRDGDLDFGGTDGPVQGTAFAAEGADSVSCGSPLPDRADGRRLRCNL
jgi:hypothetical protein